MSSSETPKPSAPASATPTDLADAERKRLEKLAAMKARSSTDQVRIGGKGTQRRKKKVLHRAPAGDDKKLQGALKKLNLTPIQGIEEVNMFKDNGEAIHFKTPKVQASLQSSTFAVTGTPEFKQFQDLGAPLLQQLGPENIMKLLQNKEVTEKLSRAQAGAPGAGGAPMAPIAEAAAGKEEDEVPELIGTFDEPSKKE